MIRGERGEDLLGALEQIATLAGWQDAYVTGTGDFALVELANEAADTFEDARILTLSGRIRRRAGSTMLELHASVEVDGQVHAGRIEAALCGQVLLVVDAVVPASARPKAVPHRSASPRESRPGASRSGASRPLAGAATSPAASPRRAAATPSAAGRPSPAGTGRSSSPALRRDRPKLQPPKRHQPAENFDEDEDDDDAYLEVEPGDFLQHPQLGLCRVVGDDNSGGTRITVDGGRIRVLRLDTMIVRSAKVDAEGRRVFPVIGPRKRR